MSWAYLRAASEVAATADPEPGSARAWTSTSSIPHQNEAIAPGPATLASPRARRASWRSERLRYFIQSYDAAGNVVAWNTAGSRPYLMLDRGLRAAGGRPPRRRAPRRGDLQVSYVFPLALLGPRWRDPPRASASTTRRPASTSRLREASFQPTRLPASPPSGPRISRPTSARCGWPSSCAPRVSRARRATRTFPPPATARPFSAGDPGFRRTIFETSVAIPNMETRAPFFPTIVLPPPTDVLNVGGG